MQTHPPIAIFGYSEAAMFLRRKPRQPIAGLISIHGPRESAVEFTACDRLDLIFDDIEPSTATDLIALQKEVSRRRWNEQNNLTEIAPAPFHVSAIIEFARRHAGASDLIMCHCGAGMSRAPAAALICLSVWLGDGLELNAAQVVARLRPGATPNPALVRMADELLGRNGRLIEAAKRVASFL
jgi:predicted protein tyrosine phosphatase